MRDINEVLAEQMFVSVRDYVTRREGPLLARIDELEKRVASGGASVVSVEITQDLDDYRKTTRTETLSDGRKFVMPLRNDGPLFLGAHKRDKEYGRGDMVVLGGSLWHCIRSTKEAPGTNSSAWMVAARKGKDSTEPQ